MNVLRTTETKEAVMTGQIFFRKTSKLSSDHRPLMAFVGIVAVSPEFPFVGEHQYTFTGTNDGVVVIFPDGTDFTALAQGHKIGDLLLKPIWRV
jgi:hypothetical protein